MNPSSNAVAGQPRLILRLEGIALFLASLYAYRLTGVSWGLFAVLILVPDISFAGYLAGPRVGAAVYNAMHSTIVPLIIGVYGLAFGPTVVFAVAVIWGAHIGIDRALGYGLKYPDAFQATHLGRIGKA